MGVLVNRRISSGAAAAFALIVFLSCSEGSTGPGLSTDDLSSDANRVVASIQVHLASSTIQVGQTTQASVTMKDRRGRPISRTVTWSSSDPAVATISGSGLVTAVKAGSANIIASSSGVTGSAPLTVGSAPPPPPPPPPGSGTILFQEDFENASLASRGWYDNTSALISTTEHVPGSTASAQYRFPAGATTPTSGGSQRHQFTPTSSLYVSYYVKYSANYVGSGKAYHPHEFYILSTLDGQYDGPSENFLDIYIEQSYQNGGKPRLAFQDNKSVNSSRGALPNNLIGVTEDRSTSGCNGVSETNIFTECYNAGTYWYNSKQLIGPVVFQPNPGPGYKNDWNKVEAYFQLNTISNGIGQKDGVAQYWFNGALIIDRHDIVYRTGARPTLQLNQFLIAPYIGDGSPVDQSMWIDNLKLATGRIP